VDEGQADDGAYVSALCSKGFHVSNAKDAAVPAPKQKAMKDKADKKSPPSPDEDPELQGLMSEIESDLREEEFKKLWQKYGTVIIAVVVFVLASVIGYQFWHEREQSLALAAAAKYEQALKDAQADRDAEALAAYNEVTSRDGSGYAALAQLGKAAVFMKDNNVAEALAAYRALADDPKADPLFRDLATVLWALHGMDTVDAAALETALTPLAAPGATYSHTAQELQALLAAKEGDTARAVTILDQLLADAETPQNIRARADELRELYRSSTQVKVDEPASPPPASTPAQ